MAHPVTVSKLAQDLAARRTPGEVLIVGLTGSVAAGKSTLAEALVAELSRSLRVETIATDGFLYPNARLAELGLMMRKGFPESYDAAAIKAALAAARTGPATFPGYSHMTYDVDPSLARIIDRPDILLLEGLGLTASSDDLDVLIYLDAEERDIEAWFVTRFHLFCEAARSDPDSFYARFSAMSRPEVDAFARQVWTGINLPNLRDHIIPARDVAHLVIKKTADHGLALVR